MNIKEKMDKQVIVKGRWAFEAKDILKAVMPLLKEIYFNMRGKTMNHPVTITEWYLDYLDQLLEKK